jgi:hypothetical protein
MKLYHVSEEADIKIFYPRPSPQFYKNIKGDVVFAIDDKMLHNYLLPRDCPRVTFYAKPDSSKSDKDKFIGKSEKKYIITVESGWAERIKQTTLYLYQLPTESFRLLDEGAGYYISYEAVKPVSVHHVTDVLTKLTKQDTELRFMPSIRDLAEEVSKSTLQFSIMRLRNAGLQHNHDN